jgi:4-aminobutyrate--pyruvate transaminase
VAAAVAVETLKIYEERNILAQVRDVAPTFQKELRRFADHPLVGECRGVGLVGAIELVKNKATKEAFDPKQAVGPTAVRRSQEHGLIVRSLVDSVAFCPPLIITKDQVIDMFARFEKALEETAAHVKANGLQAA